MANRPTNYLGWVSDGNPQKITQPPQAQRDSGWVPGEPVPAQYLNWLLSTSDQWIQFLDQQATASLSAVSAQFSGRLINSGVWSFSVASSTLAWSAAFNLAYPGLVDTVNTVAVGSVTLADGQCAYVNVNLPAAVVATVSSGSAIMTNLQTMQGIVAGQGVNGPGIPANTTVQSVNAASVTLSASANSSNAQQTYSFYSTAGLTMQVATESSLVLQKNTALLARRFGNVVAVGLNTAEAVLRDGEAKTIRNGGYTYVANLPAGVALADRQAVYISLGMAGRTQGSVYPCETNAANGAVRAQFFGFVNGATALGAGTAIVCSGIMGGFSGLNVGSTYYVDPANPGGITTTKTVVSGQFVMAVGIATSATTLIVTQPGGAVIDRPISEDFIGNVTTAGLGATASASGVLTLLTGTFLIPGTANAQDLGSSAMPFNNGFFKTLIGTQVQSSSFLTLGGSPHAFQGSIVPASTNLALGSATAMWNMAFVNTVYTNALLPFAGFTTISTPTLLPNNSAACALGSAASPYSDNYVTNLHAAKGNIFCIGPIGSYYPTTTANATYTLYLAQVISTPNAASPSNAKNTPFSLPAISAGSLRGFSGNVSVTSGNGTYQLQATIGATTLNLTGVVAFTGGASIALSFAEGTYPFNAGDQMSFAVIVKNGNQTTIVQAYGVVLLQN